MRGMMRGHTPGSIGSHRVRALASMALAGLSLGGCASTGSAPVKEGAPSRVTLEYDRGIAANDLAFTRDNRVSKDVVAAAREPLMQRLTTVYRDLGLPVNQLDTRAFIVSTGNITVNRRVAQVPADRYFGCGFTVTGGARALTYALDVSVTTQLVPAPAPDSGSTLVLTSVAVQARQPGMSGNPVACSTTGALEQRIVAALRTGTGS